MGIDADNSYGIRVLRQLAHHSGEVGKSGFAERFQSLYEGDFAEARINGVRVTKAETKRRLDELLTLGLARTTPGTPYILCTLDGYDEYRRHYPTERHVVPVGQHG